MRPPGGDRTGAVEKVSTFGGTESFTASAASAQDTLSFPLPAHVPTAAFISRDPAALDREADALLFLGRVGAAERLSHRAEALRRQVAL